MERQPPRSNGAIATAPDEMDVVRRGPYPLGALVRERWVADRVIEATVARRHPRVQENGLPQDSSVWVVGSRTGEIRASGIGPRRGLREVVERHLVAGDVKAALITSRRAANGGSYQVWWTLIE